MSLRFVVSVHAYTHTVAGVHHTLAQLAFILPVIVIVLLLAAEKRKHGVELHAR